MVKYPRHSLDTIASALAYSSVDTTSAHIVVDIAQCDVQLAIYGMDIVVVVDSF